jgi:hypothetical protein
MSEVQKVSEMLRRIFFTASAFSGLLAQKVDIAVA